MNIEYTCTTITLPRHHFAMSIVIKNVGTSISGNAMHNYLFRKVAKY